MILMPERIAFGWHITLLQPERENTSVWYICPPLEADIVNHGSYCLAMKVHSTTQ
jgi:hypothetical protein